MNDLAAAVGRLPRGWQGHYQGSAPSTQDLARAAASAGAPGRSLYVTDFQTAGRGRQGRTWTSAPGVGLLLSILLRQDEPPRPWRSTALASVALVEAIETLLPSLRPAIKWPNDVVLNGRKVAGILAESTWDGERVVIIVGVGVNVSTSAAELEQFGGSATSLRVASGATIDRGALLVAFVERLDAWMGRPELMLRAEWEARLWGRGQRLRLIDIEGEQDVVVLGVEPDGALRVRLADGGERITRTGELIL